jgi:hypothetical protein
MCLAMLLSWVVVSADLFRRDVMPSLILGPPPDFRAVAGGGQGVPTRWQILVPEGRSLPTQRKVGMVVTQTMRRPDGWARISSNAWFDSGHLLRGTPFESFGDARIEILGSYEVDSSGNLAQMRVAVREGMHAKTDLLVIDGHLKNNMLQVTTHSPFPILASTQSFPYKARGLVQSSLSPFERMPHLQIGQRWENRVVSPLTGRVETCVVEVVARRYITWNDNPVATMEIVTRMSPFSARTWVRSDGLVLRQEVPFPFVKLMLERLPD